MAKLVKISDSNAYRIEAIELNGEQYISVRQMYKRKGDTKFNPGRNGVTLPLEQAARIAKHITGLAESDETEFVKIEPAKRGKKKGEDE